MGAVWPSIIRICRVTVTIYKALLGQWNYSAIWISSLSMESSEMQTYIILKTGNL